MFKTCKRNVTASFSQKRCYVFSDETDEQSSSMTVAKRPATTGDDGGAKRQCRQQDTVQPLPASTSYQVSTLSDQPRIDSTPPADDGTRCCRNCGVYTTTCDVGICSRCLGLPFCTGCKRRLQPTCFDESSLLCQSCARRRKAPHVTVVGNVVTEIDVPIDEGDTNFDTFISSNAQEISSIIGQEQERHQSIRVVIRTTAEFSREIVEGELQHINGYFCSYPQLVATGHDFDMQRLTSELNSAVEAFNSRGSGFVLDRVVQFTVVISQYRPLSRSTFIPTPPSILKRRP